ncbi:S8 family serine peptidase [Marinobacter subterrani]|uniref:S8 family serine peptidase n=1 Tax=Marinobacter subterrani TaxID=1658765 RepID=UPI002354801F|nr:S8 family serine peptidase [Marinobacter subterrani]
MKILNKFALAACASLLMSAVAPTIQAGIKTLNAINGDHAVQNEQVTIMVKRESLAGGYPWEFVRVNADQVQETIRNLSQDPDVIDFEFDQKIKKPTRPISDSPSLSASSFAAASALDQYYNDPLFATQRIYQNNGGNTMRILEALKRANTDRKVRVGVLDSGFLSSSDTIYHNGYSFSAPEGAAYLNGEGGICPTGPTGATDPSLLPPAHGAEVASVFAATPNNQYGMAGVAPNTEVIAGRIADCLGDAFFTDITAGVLWMAGLDSGRNVAPIEPVDVINLSFSGVGTCPAYFQSAVDQAVAAGVTVVVAAGNNGGDANQMIPGSCNNVINVAATTHTGDLASFSNSGSVVDIAATGEGVTVLTHNDDNAWANGTSFAAPVVAGIISAIKSSVENVTSAEIEQALAVSGNPAISSGGGIGGGIIDAMKLMDEVGIPREQATVQYAVEGSRERYQAALMHSATKAYLQKYTNGGDACSLVEVSGENMDGKTSGQPLSVFSVIDGYPLEPTNSSATTVAQSSGDHLVLNADQYLSDLSRDYGVARCDVTTGADCSQKTTLRAIPKAALKKPAICETVAAAL